MNYFLKRFQIIFLFAAVLVVSGCTRSNSVTGSPFLNLTAETQTTFEARAETQNIVACLVNPGFGSIAQDPLYDKDIRQNFQVDDRGVYLSSADAEAIYAQVGTPSDSGTCTLISARITLTAVDAPNPSLPNKDRMPIYEARIQELYDVLVLTQ